MNRSSLIFTLLAAVLLGGLFGLSAGPRQAQQQVSETSDLSASPGPGYRFYDPFRVEIQYDEYKDPLPYADGENYVPGNKPFAHESLKISLPLDGGIEYKAVMDEGDSLVYRWKVQKGETYFDFHGHPTTGDTEFFNRYREGEADSSSGSIVAAFSGHHGWYWLNISDHPILIELEVAGFYDRIERLGVE